MPFVQLWKPSLKDTQQLARPGKPREDSQPSLPLGPRLQYPTATSRPKAEFLSHLLCILNVTYILQNKYCK